MPDNRKDNKNRCCDSLCERERELSFDELDQVRGGYTKNAGGTFTLTAGEQLSGSGYVFIVKENYPQATLDSWILVEECTESGGSLTSYGENSYTLRSIFDKTGQTALIMSGL